MVTKKAENIPSFIVMDILEEAQKLEAQGREIIHLEIGEPDFDTPEIVKKAAVKALESGMTYYTHSQGLTELRETIAEHYQEKYGVSVKPDNIIVTLGTSPALFMVLSALVEKGEEVIITDPGYSCYKNVIEFSGGKPVFLEVFDEEGYQIDEERLLSKISRKTKAVLVNSPSNPTGTTLSRESFKKISELAKKHNFYIISDEIYHGLVYEGDEICALEESDRAIVINGFSKAYAMTGWRLGYLIAPDELIDHLRRIQQNLFICASSFVQAAAIAALRECSDFVEEVKSEYRRRRDFLVPELKRLGFDIKTTPKGAFYVFAGIKRFGENSLEFVRKLLLDAGVAVTPGIDFGKNGEGYIRISYANSMENLEKAVERMERFLSK
jgi:aspartate/methionine/tyrosine aminotransferase